MFAQAGYYRAQADHGGCTKSPFNAKICLPSHPTGGGGGLFLYLGIPQTPAVPMARDSTFPWFCAKPDDGASSRGRRGVLC